MNDKTIVKYNLARMIEYIDDIKSIVANVDFVEQAFSNKIYKHAINSCLIQIGEHARRINEVDGLFVDKNVVPISKIQGLRNRMVHNYGDIDYGLLKEIIVKNLPQVEEYIYKEVCKDVIDNPYLLFENEYDDLEKASVDKIITEAKFSAEMINKDVKCVNGMDIEKE